MNTDERKQIEQALERIAQAHDETLSPIGVSYEYDPTPTAKERLANTRKHVAEVRDRLRQLLASAGSAGDAAEDTALLDYLTSNPDSVKYFAPHWYSGRTDKPSLNPDKWSSTGQWATPREALRTAKAQQPTT